MQSREPMNPKPKATYILTSTSQRPTPLHHVAVSSVGQMRGLMKLKRFGSITHMTREEAAKLRFRMCQTKGGISMMRVMIARMGNAIAAGETGKLVSAMVRNL